MPIEQILGLVTALVTLGAAYLGYRAVKDRPPLREPTSIEPPADDTEHIETTVWERTPAALPQAYKAKRAPVLVIANMKGGVGKTTIAANLAAYFMSHPRNKRVLLVDFDYQGSLSQTVLSHAGITDAQMTAHKLITGKESPDILVLRAPPMQFRRQDAGRLSLFSAHYSFATIENELMVDWLSGQRAEIRHEFLKYLTSSEFASRYDLVIVDCPPRITTATINALIGGTHLLIPTILDNLSAPAAEYFSRQLVRMRPRLFPNLHLLGVAPSITVVGTRLKENEQSVAADLEAKLEGIWPAESLSQAGPIVLTDQFLPRTSGISESAGRGLAFFRDKGATTIFTRLGHEVSVRIFGADSS